MYLHTSAPHVQHVMGKLDPAELQARNTYGPVPGSVESARKDAEEWARQVSMRARIYVCVYIRLHVCMYVCIYVCMYVCKWSGRVGKEEKGEIYVQIINCALYPRFFALPHISNHSVFMCIYACTHTHILQAHT